MVVLRISNSILENLDLFGPGSRNSKYIFAQVMKVAVFVEVYRFLAIIHTQLSGNVTSSPANKNGVIVNHYSYNHFCFSLHAQKWLENIVLVKVFSNVIPSFLKIFSQDNVSLDIDSKVILKLSVVCALMLQ